MEGGRRSEMGILAEIGVAVSGEDADKGFGDDSSADFAQMDWGAVVDELLLGFGENVEPQGSVLRKLGRKGGDALVGFRAVFIGFADFEVGVVDGLDAHLAGYGLS